MGTKADCNEKAVPWKEAQGFAAKMGVGYFETSAKTGEGVEHAFMALAKQVMDGLTKEQQKSGRQISISSAVSEK